jgi:uncharacterized protein (TIGR03435 family)
MRRYVRIKPNFETVLFKVHRAAWAIFCVSLCGQSTKDLTFEAASLKRAPASTSAPMMTGGPGTNDPTRITFTNVPLKQLFVVAYGVKRDQVSGPDWLDSDKIDLSAKIAMGSSRTDFHVMLQNLLIERFGVAVHHEQKVVPSYDLVVAKKDPKAALKTSKRVDDLPTDERRTPPMKFTVRPNGEANLTAEGVTLKTLASFLQQQLGQPVSDGTALKGIYDFEMQWSFDPTTLPRGMPFGMVSGAQASGSPGVLSDTSSSPTLFVALQETLGLKLQPGKASIDLVVIDHINREPSPN